MARLFAESSQEFNALTIPELAPNGESRLFDAVFDESQAGLIIIDVRDNFIPVISDVNPMAANWLGGERATLQGYRFFDLLDQARDQEAAASLQQAFSVRSEIKVDVNLSAGGGAPVPVHLTLKPVVMDNSRVFFGIRERYVAIMRRTEAVLEDALIQYREACEQAELARDRFLARMSHDLRTPLGGILGFADAMNMEILGPIGNERYHEYVEAILTSGRGLLGLVEDLLAQSQAWKEGIRLNKSRSDLAIVTARTVSAMKGEATANKVALVCEAEQDLKAFDFDAGAYEKALSAVLTNAIASAPESSRVHILVVTEDGAPSVVVEDSGPPIEDGQWEAEITRFNKDDDVYRKVYPRGVAGLPYAQTVMELHGGSLECREAPSIRNPDRRISVIRLQFTALPLEPGVSAEPAEADECWEIG